MGDWKQPPALIAIGASAGGIAAVQVLLRGLTQQFPSAIVLVEHNRGGLSSDLSVVFRRHAQIPIKEAEPGEKVSLGQMYIAPGNYHLLVEKNYDLSLSVDDKVNWCRPSIDVFFESAALAYGPSALGIVITGANRDGAYGARFMKDRGARILIQNPNEAEFPTMPQEAVNAVQPDRVYSLDEINEILIAIQEGKYAY